MNSAPIISIQTVKQQWIDYNGHMNIAYYTMAFDQAFDAFLSEQFGVDEKYIKHNQIGPFALQSQYTYLAEMHEGETFSTSVRVFDYDYKRIHLFSEIYRGRDNLLSATCESLSMNVNLQSRKSEAYPNDILKMIEDSYQSTKHLPVPQQIGQQIGIRRK